MFAELNMQHVEFMTTVYKIQIEMLVIACSTLFQNTITCIKQYAERIILALYSERKIAESTVVNTMCVRTGDAVNRLSLFCM